MITRTLAVATLAAATLSLAACGGSDGNTTGSPSTTGTTAASTADAGTADGSQDCGGDALAAVKKAVTSPAVQKIQVIGGCNEVSIETNLGPDAKPAGEALCDKASKVAYTGSVMSITVGGADGHELAAGIKGEPCI